MITPLDIKKHEFASKFRGYDPDEVHALLESVAKDFEELNRQNAQLSERLKVSEERVNHYRLIEKTLQDAVVTMQQTLEEKLKTAQHEADLILKQARHRAEEEMGESRERMSALRAELRTLEDQKQQFFLRMRNLLRNQTEILAATMEAEEKDTGARAAPSADG